MLIGMIVGFIAMLPQLLAEGGGILFAVVWSAMAMLGVGSLYRNYRVAKAFARQKRVLSFKKKLRTSQEEVRSRITVRLKA